MTGWLLAASWISLLIEYVVYVTVIVVGIVVLGWMRRKKHKPVEQIAVQRTQEIIKRIDGFFEAEKKQTKKTMAEHLFLAKKMQLHAEVGDLLVLIDREAMESKRIEYQEIEGCYRRALNALYELDTTWGGEETLALLMSAKKELSRALTLFERMPEGKR